MTESYGRWVAARRAEAYTELEHPSDLFLEIRGCDVPGLVENALFAFYDQIADIEGFEPRRAQILEAVGAGLDDALRSLLSEALYRFDTEGFVAADGEVTSDRSECSPADDAAPASPNPTGQPVERAG